jgi:hypothetical protein
MALASSHGAAAAAGPSGSGQATATPASSYKSCITEGDGLQTVAAFNQFLSKNMVAYATDYDEIEKALLEQFPSMPEEERYPDMHRWKCLLDLLLFAVSCCRHVHCKVSTELAGRSSFNVSRKSSLS